MILFLSMQLVPLAYASLYLIHSIRKRRKAQGVAILVLMLLLLASIAVLLWEFFAVP